MFAALITPTVRPAGTGQSGSFSLGRHRTQRFKAPQAVVPDFIDEKQLAPSPRGLYIKNKIKSDL